MKILFISGYIPNQEWDYYQAHSKVALQNAPNIFQKGIIDGLEQNGADYYVMSFPFVPSFPINFSLLYTRESHIQIGKKIVGKTYKYNTLIAYKDRSIRNRIIKSVESYVSANCSEDERFFLLAYAPPYYVMEALIAIKKKYPQAIVCPIITDLVDNMLSFASNRSFLKRIQCQQEYTVTKKLYPYMDKYVLLSEHMLEKIPEAAHKYVIVEGIYNGNLSKIVKVESSEKSLLYTGSLLGFAGIKSLVDAFMLTKNKDFRLWICGSGEYADYVKEKSDLDGRIIFYGSLSHDNVLKLQQTATTLINPRQPNGDITKYSFPSKTMEYLASGTPMIGYRLEGIPDEYFDHIFIPENLEINSLSTMIYEVLTLPIDVLHDKGSKAKSFITNNKTSKIQVKRILDFINS